MLCPASFVLTYTAAHLACMWLPQRACPSRCQFSEMAYTVPLPDCNSNSEAMLRYKDS